MYKLTTNDIDILPFSNNLSWTSDIETLGVELGFDSLYNLPEGSVVSLYIDNKEYLRTIAAKKVENKFSYSYTCFDYSFYLKNEVVKQFNTSASNAISFLLSEFGIKSKVVSIPTRIRKIYKDESISSIIDDILDQAEKEQGVKYFKEMHIDTLAILRLQDMKITPKILIPKEFSINSSIEEMKNMIIVTSDAENSKAIYAIAQDKAAQKQYGLLQEIEVIEKKDIAQARNIAENLLKTKNKVLNDTSLDVLGINGAETIKANRLIEINVSNKLAGWYRIKSAAHNLSNNKHMVNISLEW